MKDLKRIKLKYLIDCIGVTNVALELRCSKDRLTEFLASDLYPLPRTVEMRLDKVFRDYAYDDKIHELSVKYRIDVKNYDDEDMEDLKAGTSRHGPNRSHRSFGRSNNGT